MANAVIRRTTPSTERAIQEGASSIGTTKAALVVGKTALDCLGHLAKTNGTGLVASLGQRAQNLGGLFGAMASGYAINEFGESLSAAVGGALALRRGVTTEAVLEFFSGASLALGDALGAVGFVAGRGVLALGAAAPVIELAGMAAVAIGGALQVARAFVKIQALRQQIAGSGNPATPDQQRELSNLKWLAARMTMLTLFGILGVAACFTAPTLALAVASTALLTSFFAAGLIQKAKSLGAPEPTETVAQADLQGTRLFQDRVDAQDRTNPAGRRQAAQERAAGAAVDYFAGIPGLKGVQGFVRGGSDAVAIAAELAGNQELASSVSEAGGKIAGGIMPQAEVVGNAAKLVAAVTDTRAQGTDKATNVGIAGGKVLADAAKMAATLSRFKVIDVASNLLKPIDVVGKAADFTASLLTVAKPSRRAADLTNAPNGPQIMSTASRVAKWSRVGDIAKLAMTIFALAPIALGAAGVAAPAMLLRGASTVAGLTMGVARTVQHFTARAGRYASSGVEVTRVS